MNNVPKPDWRDYASMLFTDDEVKGYYLIKRGIERAMGKTHSLSKPSEFRRYFWRKDPSLGDRDIQV